MEDVKPMAAGRAFLDNLRHELKRLHGGVICRLRIGDAELARARRCRHCQQERGAQRQIAR